ncbi:MAG: hypothetical protein EOO11_21305 [Chitinophagaceae bacterium]|nr:MAG: hypothetical protein EOO11_21305 [Chitinophagaceae bacterium]
MKCPSLLTALSVGILLASCSKSKEDASGAASFDYQLKATNPAATLARVQGGALTWTAGTASAQQIKFEAKRGGSEVEYSRSLQQSVDLFAAAPVLGSISLEAGTYDEVEFKAFLAPNGATPALELQGQYVSNGVTTPVLFRANEPVLLKAEKHNVTLSAATGYQAVTPLNLALGTSGISGSAFDNAVRSNGTILITATVNSALYNSIVNNLRSSSHGEAGFHR